MTFYVRLLVSLLVVHNNFVLRSLLALFLIGATPSVLSQTAPAPVADMGKVEITSGRDNDTQQRRESTASKIVIGREEIEKQGDSNIGEVLKRMPGITLGGNPGRGGGVRMRGLSAGYTQILLDGQRVPPGFSLNRSHLRWSSVLRYTAHPLQRQARKLLREPSTSLPRRASWHAF